MKIALFTETFDEINGVAHTYRKFAAYCKKNNIILDIFTHSEVTSVEEIGSVRIIRIKPKIPFKIDIDLSQDFLSLVRRIHPFIHATKQDYNLIHLTAPGSMGMNGRNFAISKNIPTIGTYHTSVPEYVRERTHSVLKYFGIENQAIPDLGERLAWKFVSRYYEPCRKVLVPTEPVKNLLKSKLSNKISIFGRGVDSNLFNPIHRVDTPCLTILYVGRVVPEKNLHVFKNLSLRENEKLKIVGDGLFLKQLKRLCPDAVYTGFLFGQDLSSAYASADIFAFPSETDTNSNTLLEAMSSGLPVVVTDKGGPQQHINEGVTGYIASNTQIFIERVEYLKRNPELRLELGNNAREYAKTKSWDAAFAGLIDQYKQVILQSNSGSLNRE